MRKRVAVGIVAVALFIFSVTEIVHCAQAQTATTSSTQALTGDDLQAQINDKNKQLQIINQQLQSTQATLQSTQQQKNTLQNQVKSLDANIQTLNLNMQSDSITSQQLQLEIEQLNGDLSDITATINDKETAIQSILQQLEKNDATNGNLLVTFLKQNSLADGVLEAQSIHNLQSQLSIDINNLRDLHDQYNQEIDQSTSKKNQVLAHQQDLQNRASIVKDQENEKQTLLAATKGQESAYQKQVAALLKQQQQIASDIESLDAILRTKVNPGSLPTLGAGVLLMPITGFTSKNISQGYGATDFAKNGYAGHWHNGLDFGTPIGTPIMAADDGVIVGVANEDLYCPKGAYGKFIAINHTNGLTTLYGHLSKQLVIMGQSVKRGQVIGYSGKTGYATGPHLHFTVFAQSTFVLKNSPSCGPLPVGGDLNPYGYLF